MPRMPVTDINKQVAQLEARLNKSAQVKGARVLKPIDEAPNTYFLRRPSGIMQLDIDTGGGIPAGGLTYISGPQGGGKSFLFYKYCAMNQRLYGKSSVIALGCTEQPPDHFFMRQAGMQVAIPEKMIDQAEEARKALGLKGFTKEELKDFRKETVGKVEIITGLHGEELLNTVIDCFDSRLFDLIGVDSVSMLLPEADADKDLDENEKRAATAGLLTKFFKHYLSGTTGYNGTNNTSVVFIAQARSNSKKSEALPHMAKYMKDWATEGAWAARHGKLIDITMWSGAKEKEEVKGAATLADMAAKEKKRVQTGKTINYEITKGKAGIHEGVTGEIEFTFANQVDDVRTVIVAGFQSGVVMEKDGLLTVIRRSTGEVFEGLHNIAGVDRLCELIRSDFELEVAIRREVLYSRGITCLYGSA